MNLGGEHTVQYAGDEIYIILLNQCHHNTFIWEKTQNTGEGGTEASY